MKMKMLLSILLAMAGLLTLLPMNVPAEEARFELKASATIPDILRERVGKRTTLRMQSGEDIEGTVVMVGNSMVHVAKLPGKDFFDAVISIDRISAVIMQVRSR